MSLNRSLSPLEILAIGGVAGLLVMTGCAAILLRNGGLMLVFALATATWTLFLLPWRRLPLARRKAALEPWAEVGRTVLFEIELDRSRASPVSEPGREARSVISEPLQSPKEFRRSPGGSPRHVAPGAVHTAAKARAHAG